jgi:hypothetical protein
MRKRTVGFLDPERSIAGASGDGRNSAGTRRRAFRLRPKEEADMSDPHPPIPTTPDPPPVLPPDPTFPPKPIEEPDPDLLPDELPNPNPDENIEPPKRALVEPGRQPPVREPCRTAAA